jgi:hypothetical protein
VKFWAVAFIAANRKSEESSTAVFIGIVYSFKYKPIAQANRASPLIGHWQFVIGNLDLLFEDLLLEGGVFGIWYWLFGIWNLLFEIWIWYLLFGILGFGIWNLVFGIWLLQFGNW